MCYYNCKLTIFFTGLLELLKHCHLENLGNVIYPVSFIESWEDAADMNKANVIENMILIKLLCVQSKIIFYLI